ncbi:hypothetical protein GGR51DRAFT_562801 [Nemania sp. FL0031]|nr:hypothetical protein GGR51DRAFT_562801 [Nemania sp. FL0031]
MPTVTLRTSDWTNIVVDQSILIKSQYFKSALTNQWLESETQEVDFLDNSLATDRALKAYIAYLQGEPIPDIHTGKYSHLPKYIQELHELGDYFCDNGFRRAQDTHLEA